MPERWSLPSPGVEEPAAEARVAGTTRTALVLERPMLLLALVPVAALPLAAAVPEVRLAVLALTLVGSLALLWRGEEVAWAWAAGLPVAAIYAWGLTVTPALATPGPADCTNPLSPPALWRFLELCTVVALAAALAAGLNGSRASLGLVAPGGGTLVMAVGLGAAATLASIHVGQTIGEEFFGPYILQPSLVWGMLPALLFAGSNAVLEEFVYRGALLGWASRVYGVAPALALQAVVFGLAHLGPGFVSSPLPVVLGTATLGLVAGVIRVRTGSLLVPIAVHVAFDVPLYFFTACRVP